MQSSQLDSLEVRRSGNDGLDLVLVSVEEGSLGVIDFGSVENNRGGAGEAGRDSGRQRASPFFLGSIRDVGRGRWRIVVGRGVRARHGGRDLSIVCVEEVAAGVLHIRGF